MEPPELVKLVGRPKVNRYRQKEKALKRQREWKKSIKGKLMTCSTCGEQNHNMRSCKKGKLVAAASKKAAAATKKAAVAKKKKQKGKKQQQPEQQPEHHPARGKKRQTVQQKQPARGKKK